MNNECNCKQAVDLIKVVAREGIVRELQFQLARCESERDVLAKRIEMLLVDLAVATNGTR